MRPFFRAAVCAALALLLAACAAAPAPSVEPVSLRVATFNTSLFDEAHGGLAERLDLGDEDARRIAATLQHLRPDIVLLNEFDYDPSGRTADLFQQRYLQVGQYGQAPITYPYRYLAPVNTGLPSGLDLDGDGRVGGEGRFHGNDAWGYGLHPGQYGMLVLSRHPIDAAAVRTFQHLKWSAMPRASAPVRPDTGQPFYAPATWAQLRLSSKSHWDVPIDTPRGRLHLLAAHPTPPVFDGPERRNAHRNHDEVRLWAEYLSPGNEAWLCDDAGRCGGLPEGERFVIVGDYNADPAAGGALPGTIQQLLEHPRVLRIATPRSEGGAVAAQAWASGRGPDAPAAPAGSPLHATAHFGRSGLFRVDYALPSVGWTVAASGVFWPAPGQPGADWLQATDHRLVWVDLE